MHSICFKSGCSMIYASRSNNWWWYQVPHNNLIWVRNVFLICMYTCKCWCPHTTPAKYLSLTHNGTIGPIIKHKHVYYAAAGNQHALQSKWSNVIMTRRWWIASCSLHISSTKTFYVRKSLIDITPCTQIGHRDILSACGCQ